MIQAGNTLGVVAPHTGNAVRQSTFKTRQNPSRAMEAVMSLLRLADKVRERGTSLYNMGKIGISNPAALWEGFRTQGASMLGHSVPYAEWGGPLVALSDLPPGAYFPGKHDYNPHNQGYTSPSAPFSVSQKRNSDVVLPHEVRHAFEVAGLGESPRRENNPALRRELFNEMLRVKSHTQPAPRQALSDAISPYYPNDPWILAHEMIGFGDEPEFRVPFGDMPESRKTMDRANAFSDQVLRAYNWSLPQYVEQLIYGE